MLVFAVILTAVGIVFGVMSVDRDGNGTGHFANVHAWFGVIGFCVSNYVAFKVFFNDGKSVVRVEKEARMVDMSCSPLLLNQGLPVMTTHESSSHGTMKTVSTHSQFSQDYFGSNASNESLSIHVPKIIEPADTPIVISDSSLTINVNDSLDDTLSVCAIEKPRRNWRIFYRRLEYFSVSFGMLNILTGICIDTLTKSTYLVPFLCYAFALILFVMLLVMYRFDLGHKRGFLNRIKETFSRMYRDDGKVSDMRGRDLFVRNGDGFIKVGTTRK